MKDHKEGHHKENHKKDSKKVFNINPKVLNIAVIILLLIIPMTLSFYYRYQPAELPAMDMQAADIVINHFKSQVEENVNKQYAYLPEEKKNEIINQEMSTLLKQEKDKIKENIDQIAKQFKSGMQDENGYTYLIAIDPWMQYQYTLNYLKTGTAGDTVIDGIPYNTHRYGRNPAQESGRFHPWLMAKVHNILSIFNPDTTPMRSVFFFPLIWVTISIIPAFFIGRKLSNNLGGFITACIVAVHHAIMSRTVAGFSDTDAHNVFFPLFIMWFIIESFESKDNWAKTTLASLAGLFTGIYAIAWTGWWYTFDFIIFALVFFIVYKLLKEREHIRSGALALISKVKDSASVLGVYIMSSFIFVVGLLTFSKGVLFSSSLFDFAAALRMPLKFLQMKDVGITSIWPNVFTTVAELNPASLQKVITSMGEPLLFFTALMGLVLVMVPLSLSLSKQEKYLIGGAVVWNLVIMFIFANIKSTYLFLVLLAAPVAIIGLYGAWNGTNFKLKYGIFLTLFLTGTFLASTRGVRFVALFVPIFAIATGVAAGKFHSLAGSWVSKALSINKILVRAVLVILLLWIILPTPINAGWQQATREMPSYNDAWDDTLKFVNQSSDDAIITSWWDFGHWFVAGSERRVTFDGGSQTDRIHWVGRSLLTNNESEAVSILRMLNCGQNNARFRLEDAYEDNYKAIKVLYDVIASDKENAEKVLKESGLGEEDVKSVLEKTHCEDLIDQYFIASEDMIQKSGVWGHFGTWDFDRAYLFNSVKSKEESEGISTLVDEFGYNENEAEDLYYEIQSAKGDQWISPWPSYASKITSCEVQNRTVICGGTGAILDLESEEAYVMTSEGQKRPRAVSFLNGEGFVHKEYFEDSVDYGVIIFPAGTGRFNSIAALPEQTASMFTRMYFFAGIGLDNFEQVLHKSGVDGTDIFLYKLNWEGNEA